MLYQLSFVTLFTFTALLGSAHAYPPVESDSWQSIDTVYEVPVTDDLREYAMFKVSDAQVRSRDGLQEVKYTLPLEITGGRVEVHLKSVPGKPGEFKGSNSDAKCDPFQCRVTYRAIRFDETKVREMLLARRISSDEFEKRMAVFARFSGDPAGVVHFVLTANK